MLFRNRPVGQFYVLCVFATAAPSLFWISAKWPVRGIRDRLPAARREVSRALAPPLPDQGHLISESRFLLLKRLTMVPLRGAGQRC